MENVIQPMLQPAARSIGGPGAKIGDFKQKDLEDLYFNGESEGTPVRTYFPPEIDVKGAAGSTFVGDPEGEARKVAEGNSRFALELYSKLAEKKEGNLFFAPLGISTALAMTYVGAEGETSKEMGRVLHFDDLPKDRLHQAFGSVTKDLTSRLDREDCTFTVANRIWTHEGAKVESRFQKTVEGAYGAPAQIIDFEDPQGATETINSWVAEKTRDKIKSLIPPGVLNEDTRMVLTNALYFKASWADKFDPKKTSDATFQADGAKLVDVPMMHKTGTFKYGEFFLDKGKSGVPIHKPYFVEGLDVQVLELPYSGDDLSMVFILPKDQETLSKLEKSLDPDQVNDWLDRLQEKTVIASVPKFNLTSSFKMKDVLSEMGMGRAFSNGADFSGISGKKDLTIGEVIHKATVEVNEQGAEGGAGTAVVMMRKTCIMNDPIFQADHPFLFAIRDKNAGILCMGRVSDPSKN